MIFDTISHIDNYKGLGRVTAALEFLAKTDFSQLEVGKYTLDGDNIFYMVQEYCSKVDSARAEAHKRYIDIQFLVSGQEYMGVAPLECEKTETEAREEKDVWFYDCKTENITLNPGSFAILYPNDIHRPGVAIDGSVPCKKVVVKVKV